MHKVSTYFDYVKNNFICIYRGVVWAKFKNEKVFFPMPYSANDEISFEIRTYQDNLTEVAAFYKSCGKGFLSDGVLEKIIGTRGAICVAKFDDKIIAADCLLTDELFLHGNSKYTLCEKIKGTVVVDKNILYSCYLIVDSKYRSNGIYQSMINYQLKYLEEREDIKGLLTITGTSNLPMMHICNKYFDFIGMYKVCLFMKIFLLRKELYLDNKRKCWKTIH